MLRLPLFPADCVSLFLKLCTPRENSGKMETKILLKALILKCKQGTKPVFKKILKS